MNECKMKKIITLSLSFVLVLLFLKSAAAYIDPGTGAMVISSTWSVISVILAAAGAFVIRIFFKPIKKGIDKIWNLLRGKGRKD